MKKLVSILACFVLCAAALFASGQGQKFPSKQINIVVGAAPGGTSDVVTRALGKLVEADLGVPVVVNNRPGGSSAVATEYMAAQVPDGYNLMYMPVENAMIKPLGFSQIEPSNLRYFARAMTLPATVTVNVNSPWNSFADLIAYAKANPGRVTAGNSGPGSIWHFAAAGIEMATGVTFNHVPFDSGTAAATAVMGGHVDVCPVAPGEVKAGVDSGKLKVLAVVDNERSALYPNAPCLKELGYNVEILGWGSFAGPGQMPDDVLKVLEGSFAKAIQSKEFQDLCLQYGLTPGYLNAADAQKFANDQAAWYQQKVPTMNLVK